MTLYEKIRSLCRKNGFEISNIAEHIPELNVTKASVSRWKTGAVPRANTLNKIAEYFGVSPEYLRGEDAISPDIPRLFNAFPVGKQGMRPIYGSISAGLGEYVESDNEILGLEPVEAKYDTDDYFYLRVVGDSMSPKIEDGDLLLIRKQESVDSGDIGAFIVDNEEGFVKRVMYGADYITFVSLNSVYDPISFVGADVQRVRVVGKVIKIVKNL